MMCFSGTIDANAIKNEQPSNTDAKLVVPMNMKIDQRMNTFINCE